MKILLIYATLIMLMLSSAACVQLLNKHVLIQIPFALIGVFDICFTLVFSLYQLVMLLR